MQNKAKTHHHSIAQPQQTNLAGTNAFVGGSGFNRMGQDASSGTMAVRVGSDSQKDFDSCWLCSQRCESPVVTPNGMLYCHGCIIENMAEQKKVMKRKLAEFNEQELQKADKALTTEQVAQSVKDAARLGIEDSILPTSGAQLAKEVEAKQQLVRDASDADGIKKSGISSFWIATNAPEYKKEELTKPDMAVRDPFLKKPLKLKQLKAVVWTEQREASGKSMQADGTSGRYMCPISKATFKNGTEILILPDGEAVSKKALEKCYGTGKEKDLPSFPCPLSGATILKSHLIELVKGGTAFAASMKDAAVGGAEAKKYRPSLTMAIS